MAILLGGGSMKSSTRVANERDITGIPSIKPHSQHSQFTATVRVIVVVTLGQDGGNGATKALLLLTPTLRTAAKQDVGQLYWRWMPSVLCCPGFLSSASPTYFRTSTFHRIAYVANTIDRRPQPHRAKHTDLPWPLLSIVTSNCKPNPRPEMPQFLRP